MPLSFFAGKSRNELLWYIDKCILNLTKDKEEIRMHSYMKSFFSEARAERFAGELKAQGIKDVQITSAIDGFGQIQYRVEWNA